MAKNLQALLACGCRLAFYWCIALQPQGTKLDMHNVLFCVIQYYGLIDNKEMAPLQELIDKFSASTPMPT
jgi:hypothetical protein